MVFWGYLPSSDRQHTRKRFALVDNPVGHQIVVLRRKGESILGRIVEFGILSSPILMSILGPPTFTLFDLVAVSLAISAVSWLLGAISNARVVVSDAGLSVINWIVRWWIPWSAVAAVDVDEEIGITLTDGRVIRPSIGTGSGIDVLRGNRYQKNIAEVILSHRPPSVSVDDTKVVTLRPNIYPWHFALPACLLVAFTVTVYFLRH